MPGGLDLGVPFPVNRYRIRYPAFAKGYGYSVGPAINAYLDLHTSVVFSVHLFVRYPDRNLSS